MRPPFRPFFTSLTLLTASWFCYSGGTAVAEPLPKGNSGKSIFLGNRCNRCHPVSAARIKTTRKKAKGPDLSKVGKSFPAAEMTRYLQGKGEREGDTHTVSFKGSDEELQALVRWLSSPRMKR